MATGSTTDTTTQSNKPYPYAPTTLPSLLWAHELRRENIHLINQLDTTRLDLAAAVDTINELKRAVDELVRRCIRDVNATIHKELEGLEPRLEEKLAPIVERIGAVEVEVERGLLREKERERGVWEGKMLERVLGQVRELMVLGGLKDRIGEVAELGPRPCLGSDVLVPDSMPLRDGGGDGDGDGEDGVLSMVSDTTWGSGELGGDLDGDGDGDGDVDLYVLMGQGGRSLEEYLAAAERMRVELLLRKGEGEIVEAFVRGIDDVGVQIRIEREVSLGEGGGWSWDGVKDIVQKIMKGDIGGGEERGKVGEGRDDGDVVKEASKNVERKKKRKQRRFIPIVPVDEEDADIIAAMMCRR
ncbi:hypothetical protein BO71DRAFT_380812 [Aspergillus ellipticus CBS 707.79]|uniref:Uncharacterized protein n=1 Tax=Aspergillus ellipticus CBS 707.79 TaxID=1448320 RepID=A0A319D933_9EURO|nr:hypothetical protein BO71DRAFT_380812 [Aspergillus ellipticus CBS 707.79]